VRLGRAAANNTASGSKKRNADSLSGAEIWSSTHRLHARAAADPTICGDSSTMVRIGGLFGRAAHLLQRRGYILLERA